MSLTPFKLVRFMKALKFLLYRVTPFGMPLASVSCTPLALPRPKPMPNCAMLSGAGAELWGWPLMLTATNTGIWAVASGVLLLSEIVTLALV